MIATRTHTSNSESLDLTEAYGITGNLEQYFVLRTLYSDEFCWMYDNVFIHEVHLAQSIAILMYSRQT